MSTKRAGIRDSKAASVLTLKEGWIRSMYYERSQRSRKWRTVRTWLGGYLSQALDGTIRHKLPGVVGTLTPYSYQYLVLAHGRGTADAREKVILMNFEL
jgi:hypothetical protein